MANKNVLVLNFVNAKGKEIKITINSPVSNLSANTVKDAMQEIIPLGTVSGNYDTAVVKSKSAYYIKTQSESVKL